MTIQRMIQDSKQSKKDFKNEEKRSTMDWNDYHDHDTINGFIEGLAETYEFASVIHMKEEI